MNDDVDKGITANQNAGIGQERVGEPGPAPRQKAERPPTAGGPGTGSGDDAITNSEDQRARSGPDVYAPSRPSARR
jgi:hypothetical protein